MIFHQHTGLLNSIVSSATAQGSIQSWVYEWDALGNLQYRQDQVTGNRKNFTETFETFGIRYQMIL